MLGKIGALGSSFVFVFAAFSQSNNLELQNYSVGSGGTNNASSSTYRLNSTSGEITGQGSSSATKALKPSSIEAQQANVPSAPTLSNGSGTYYNKLDFVINMNGDPNDYTYAVAVSSDAFVTTRYVQADGTLGSNQVYRTYSAWGGGGGSTMTGLEQSTYYEIKVAAKQGDFTNSAFGPTAAETTVGPQISFSVNTTLVNLGDLLPNTVVQSPGSLILFSTNGTSGGNVYIAGANSGLKSTATNTTISAVTGDLDVLSQGFGVQATGTYGGLTSASPYNGSNSNIGVISTTYTPFLTTVTETAASGALLRVFAKATNVTPSAADYEEIITLVAAASF